jgi:creatinine amidohydrolase
MGKIGGGEGRALHAANLVVPLPMGSHEDQGPYAPMGDDPLDEMAREVQRRAVMIMPRPHL